MKRFAFRFHATLPWVLLMCQLLHRVIVGLRHAPLVLICETSGIILASMLYPS